MNREITAEEQSRIDKIMQRFNFNRAFIAMSALRWRYGFDNKPITLQDIQSVALYLLREICKRDKTWMETGGFRVERSSKSLRLMCVIEEAEVEYDDEA